jgi:hypothetical protein
MAVIQLDITGKASSSAVDEFDTEPTITATTAPVADSNAFFFTPLHFGKIRHLRARDAGAASTTAIGLSS